MKRPAASRRRRARNRPARWRSHTWPRPDAGRCRRMPGSASARLTIRAGYGEPSRTRLARGAHGKLFSRRRPGGPRPVAGARTLSAEPARRQASASARRTRSTWNTCAGCARPSGDSNRPGQRTCLLGAYRRASISTTCCPCPRPKKRSSHLAARVREVQDFLGRQILIENLSAYLTFAASQLTEGQFLAAVVERSGCGLLLDVNNAYVNSVNLGLELEDSSLRCPAPPCRKFISQVIPDAASATHELLIDDHGSAVCDESGRPIAEAATVRPGADIDRMGQRCPGTRGPGRRGASCRQLLAGGACPRRLNAACTNCNPRSRQGCAARTIDACPALDWAEMADLPRSIAASRLGVYRNNARHFFRTALERTYPVVRHRVGDEYFRQLAHVYRTDFLPRTATCRASAGTFPHG